MKIKLLIVIAVLFITATALQAQVSFGITAGPNFQAVTGKDYAGDNIEHGMIVGFHAGVNALFPIAPDFFFQPGILYSQKGGLGNSFMMATKSSNDEFSTTLRISYLELPLNLLYRPQFGNGHILIGFGPYVAMGLGGNQVYKYGNDSYEQKVKFFNEIGEDDWDFDYAFYKRFDAGANIFVGYELEMGLFLRLNAQLGLLNIRSAIEDFDSDESSFKNTGFGVSIGYNF